MTIFAAEINISFSMNGIVGFLDDKSAYPVLFSNLERYRYQDCFSMHKIMTGNGCQFKEYRTDVGINDHEGFVLFLGI